MDKIPMTALGKEKLEEELHTLKTLERPRIIKAIAEARAHGDLKENAEYHAAKEQQGFTEHRIKEIEGKLSHAHVIDITKIPYQPKVIFGATITLVQTDTAQEKVYQIVGADEADVHAGKISVHSPIARSLIGKTLDDHVKVDIPAGQIEFDIIKIDYL